MRTCTTNNKDRIKQLRSRLELYYNKEKEMLKGAKSYTIGARSLSKYEAALSDIRKTINELEEEIKALEGHRPRKAVGVVPRDDW